MFPAYRQKSFWDELDQIKNALGQTVGSAFGWFGENIWTPLDRAAGGWLPGGIESPEVAASEERAKSWQPPEDATPFWGGLHKAISAAIESPTTPEHIFQARDVPVVGPALRLGEAAVNVLNLPSEWAAGQAALGLAGVRQAISPITGQPLSSDEAERVTQWREAVAGGNILRATELGGEAFEAATPEEKFVLQLGADPTNLATFGIGALSKARALSRVERLAKGSEQAAALAEKAGDMAKAEALRAEAQHWSALSRAGKEMKWGEVERALEAGLGPGSVIQESRFADDLDRARAAMAREGAFVKGVPQGVSPAEKLLTMLNPARLTNEARAQAAANATTNVLATLADTARANPALSLPDLLDRFVKLDFPVGDRQYDAFRVLARSRAGTTARVLMRDMMSETGRLNLKNLISDATDPKLSTAQLMERWHDAVANKVKAIYPETPKNPYQRAIASWKDFSTRYMYMGYAPGTMFRNLFGNLVPMIYDGVFDIASSLRDLAHWMTGGIIPRSGLAKWAEQAGGAMFEAGTGIGAADVATSRALAGMSRAQKTKALLKGGPVLRLHQYIEKVSSLRIYWSQFRRYFKTFVASGIVLTPPNVPGLSQEVINDIINFSTINAHRPRKVREYILSLGGTRFRRSVLSEAEAIALKDPNNPLSELADRIVDILERTKPGGDLENQRRFIAEMDKLVVEARGKATTQRVNKIRQRAGKPPIAPGAKPVDDAAMKLAAEDLAEGLAKTGGEKEAATRRVWIPDPEYDRAITARQALQDVTDDKLWATPQYQMELIKRFMVGANREPPELLQGVPFIQEFMPIVREAIARAGERPFLRSGAARRDGWTEYFFPLATRLEQALTNHVADLAEGITPPPPGTRPATARSVAEAAGVVPPPGAATKPPPETLPKPTRPPVAEGETLADVGAEVAMANADQVQRLVDEMVSTRLQGWNETIAGMSKKQVEAIDAWYRAEYLPQVSLARHHAGRMAVLDRDFALHDYSQKRNYDIWLSYIMPYSFWQTETAKKWAQRIARNPEVLLAYARYREQKQKIEEDLPPAYRNQVRVPGTPLMVNLEAMLNPVYQSVDQFRDAAKAVTPAGNFVDTIAQIGPSIHAPLLVAFGLTQPDASAWIPYLTSGTRVVQAVTSAAGIGGPQGINIEAIPRAALTMLEPGAKGVARMLPGARAVGLGFAPADQYEPYAPETAVPAEATGIPAYERYDPSRITKALLALKEQRAINPETGRPITDSDIEKAAFLRSGALWDMGMQANSRRRLLQVVSGFLLGPGLRPADEIEAEIYKVRQEYYGIRQIADEQARKAAYRAFYEKYPWYPATQAAYKSERELEAAWKKQDFFNILDDFVTPRVRSQMTEAERNAIDHFYEVKGDVTKLTSVELATLEAALTRARAEEAALTPEQKASRAAAADLMKQYMELKAAGNEARARQFWRENRDAISEWYGDPETNRAYRVLGDYLTPRIKRGLSEAEREVIDRFYAVDGDFTKFTNEERDLLRATLLKLESNYRALSLDEQEELSTAREQIKEYYAIKEKQGSSAARDYWNAHPLLQKWYGGSESGRAADYRSQVRYYLGVGRGGGSRASAPKQQAGGLIRPVKHHLPRGRTASAFWK